MYRHLELLSPDGSGIMFMPSIAVKSLWVKKLVSLGLTGECYFIVPQIYPS